MQIPQKQLNKRTKKSIQAFNVYVVCYDVACKNKYLYTNPK